MSGSQDWIGHRAGFCAHELQDSSRISQLPFLMQAPCLQSREAGCLPGEKHTRPHKCAHLESLVPGALKRPHTAVQSQLPGHSLSLPWLLIPRKDHNSRTHIFFYSCGSLLLVCFVGLLRTGVWAWFLRTIEAQTVTFNSSRKNISSTPLYSKGWSRDGISEWHLL